MMARGAVNVARVFGRRAVVAGLLVACVTSVALAHATLRRADPPIGGRVARPPRELRLEFSEAVAARTSRVELIAPDSQPFALLVRGDSALPNVLRADVPPLTAAGPYRVEWRLVGSDGHAVTGKYGFVIDSIPVVKTDTIIASPEGAESHIPPSDSLGQQGIRFASSLALLVAVGSIALALFVMPAVARSPNATSYRDAVDDRLRSAGTLAAWSLLILAVVRLVSHAAVLGGSVGALRISDLGDLISSSTFGRGWLLQVLGSIALVAVLRARAPAGWRMAAGTAVLLSIAAALLGHAAAVADVQVFAVGVDATHALAAGGWAGAILVISVTALPSIARVTAEHRLTVARHLLRAFSPLALVCAVILAATGVASAWMQLGDVGLVLNSPYGLALIRKVVVVVLIAALGAYHWRIAQPSLDTERSFVRLRTSLALDVILVVLILALTAVLTGTAPPVR
jgi:copper transport protein